MNKTYFSEFAFVKLLLCSCKIMYDIFTLFLLHTYKLKYTIINNPHTIPLLWPVSSQAGSLILYRNNP